MIKRLNILKHAARLMMIAICAIPVLYFYSCAVPASYSGSSNLVSASAHITMVACTTQVNIKLSGSDTVSIDWGDGSEPEARIISNNTLCKHIYSDASAHTIRIYGENITYLDCYNNRIVNLDVSNNTALESLNCHYNKLTALDVSNNTALTFLACGSNQLTDLDINNNTALIQLHCSFNQLTNLNANNNTALMLLACRSNKLTALDINSSTALTVLDCCNNQFSADGLNSLFGTLHGNTVSEGKNIYIRNNPGTNSCNRSIVTIKGWTVFDSW